MGRTSVESAHVGTSGWAYPSWKPGFYPAGTDSSEFLRHYAGLFDTVELNTTGYRLPTEEQFKRWADAVPEGFTFAPKLPGNRPRIVSEFAARARHLGEHLGPVRVTLTSPRDDGMLTLLLGSLDPELRLAFDLQDESWDGVEPVLTQAGAVRVNDTESPAQFRYLRLREPPYDDETLAPWAEAIRSAREETWCFIRHEDEPTAPAYAARLLELVAPSPAK